MKFPIFCSMAIVASILIALPARADETTRSQYDNSRTSSGSGTLSANHAADTAALEALHSESRRIGERIRNAEHEMANFDQQFYQALNEVRPFPDSLSFEEIDAIKQLMQKTNGKSKPSYLAELLRRESSETILRGAALSMRKPGVENGGFSLANALEALKKDPALAKQADDRLKNINNALVFSVEKAKNIAASGQAGADFFGRLHLLEQQAKLEAEMAALWNKHTMESYGMSGAEYAAYLERQKGPPSSLLKSEEAYRNMRRELGAGTKFFGVAAGLLFVGDFFNSLRGFYGSPDAPSSAAVVSGSTPRKAPPSESGLPPSTEAGHQPPPTSEAL